VINQKLIKMKILHLLLATLICSLCTAQVDYLKHNQLLLSAHRSKELKDYKNALNFYEEAFKLNGGISISEYLNAAECAAELNKSETCARWIEASITDQKSSKKSIVSFSANELYQDQAAKVLLNYDQLITEYYDKIENLAVYFKIQGLLNRDQFSRELGQYHSGISEKDQEKAFDGFLEAQHKKDSLAMRKYQAILWPKVSKEHKAYQDQVVMYTDSLNIRELMEITEIHGWQEQAHLLLWHQRGGFGTNNWVWSYFKPLIDKEIQAGKLPPSYWAAYEDIKAIYKTGLSIYGYHPGSVDPKTVNENRKQIGLPLLTKAEIEHRNENPHGGRMF
jgi:hypothetical protein